MTERNEVGNRLVNRDTYAFIDVSNIRAACLKTLGFRVDFKKLLVYLREKYPNLKDVRYYEGIAKGDVRKHARFRHLESCGYTICPLERKSYITTESEAFNVECSECGHKWVQKVVRERRVMKSNVDVYLATELLAVANDAKTLTHIILLSCDGDYAEMIKSAISRNENVSVSVLATPPVEDVTRNTLSVSLRRLRNELSSRYQLTNIASIIDLIRQD